jgi:acetate kinase
MSRIPAIVAINSGSSSLKFKLFSTANPPRQLAGVNIPETGSVKSSIAEFPFKGPGISFNKDHAGPVAETATRVINWLKQQNNNYEITAIGHRVVQGGLVYNEPEQVNKNFLNRLTQLIPLAPLHLPDAIETMHLFLQAFPSAFQLACFDTWFHRNMPFPAKFLPVPRKFWEEGLVRYGFHGLSCQYILETLLQTDPMLKRKKIIIAHLGSGCSVTAVKENNSIDTTMSFTPTGGTMMNTRSGDIDPNVVTYLYEKNHANKEELDHLFNKESGIKAVAESGDPIQLLIERRESDPKAEQAIQMFCYHIKKQIGALTAVLGGLDILVFTGGIGEHQPVIRETICDGLEFLGIHFDRESNNRSAPEISRKNSEVSIRVITADEEFIIAKQTMALLKHQEQHY